MNPEQRAAVDATGEVFVSAGAGTGKTWCWSSASWRRLRARARRRVGARHHLHPQGGRRIARAHPRGAARARPATTSRGGSTARGSRRSTASARASCERIRLRWGSTRASASSTTSRRGIRGEAFERALAGFCSTRDPERLRLLATYGAQGLRRMLTGVYETLRSAGRDLKLALGTRRRSPNDWPSCTLPHERLRPIPR